MTLSELKKSVALLGFERSVDNIDETAGEAFLRAVSRAVSFVNSLRPVTESFVLSVTDTGATIDGVTVTPSQMAEVMQFTKFVFDKKILRLRTPIREDGRYLEGSLFRIENQKNLLLHNSFRGRLLIEYNVEMPIYTVDTPENAELPLDSELCLILDNLVAYYLLLDDNPDNALEYKNKFNERYQMIDSQTRKTHTDIYYSTNNW